MHVPEPLYSRTKPFAKDHPLTSWWCIISTAFLLGLALAGTHPALPLAVRILCCGFTALLMVRMFVIYHDHQHRSILPKSRVADFYMRIFGMLVLCPSSVWRSSHDYHHAHNSKLRSAYIGSYPIMTRDQFATAGTLERLDYLFKRHPVTILFGYVFVFLLGMVVLPSATSPRKHYDCVLALLLHLALIATLVIVSGWLTALLTLIVPLFIGSALGTYLFYIQHNFPGVVFRDKNGWTHEGAALESSSFLKTNPIMNWFTANIGYHHIHHLNHRIPFYRLPEVYRAIPELQRAKVTSLHPREIVRCLRLKVWCVKSQSLVGLRSV